jgi:hypothetical protein
MRSNVVPVLAVFLSACQPTSPTPPGPDTPPRAGETAAPEAPPEPEVVAVAPDAVDPANEGKLVYLTGPAASERHVDEATGVAFDAIGWDRTVEMYQRNETTTRTRKKRPDGKVSVVATYTYAFAWRRGRIDTTAFRDPEERGRHVAPEMKITSKRGGAALLRIGAYTVPSMTYHALEAQPVDPSAQALVDEAVVHEGWIYLAGDPKAPKLGDLRVKYEAVPPGRFSVIGKQKGGQLIVRDGQGKLLDTGAIARGEVPPETLRARIGTQRSDAPLSTR